LISVVALFAGLCSASIDFIEPAPAAQRHER
jgi:hypothetical protein